MEPSVQPAGNRVNLRLYIGAEAVMTDLVRSNKKTATEQSRHRLIFLNSG